MDTAACALCGGQPERIDGSARLWLWYSVRCRNVLCVEHGTVRHLTPNKAATCWNLRQRLQTNILRNAATVINNKTKAKP